MIGQQLKGFILLSLFFLPSFWVQHTQGMKIYNERLTLIFKADVDAGNGQFGELLRENLERIGIDLNVVYQSFVTFPYELSFFRDFDISYLSFYNPVPDPEPLSCYPGVTMLDLIGYKDDLDWDENLGMGKTAWYLERGKEIMPPASEERLHHYWEWQNHLMDKVLPIVPTFPNNNRFLVSWANLKGYNAKQGILQSWGKMQWDSTHQKQTNTNELIVAYKEWSDLNPLTQEDEASRFISNMILEPLVWFDANGSVWPHLAKHYTYINDTTLEIQVRDGVKWARDPEGMFPNEYLNSKDIYFSLYVWKHLSNKERFSWIKKVKIIDDKTVWLYIDANNETAENNPYYLSLYDLTMAILPEHYLNQSQLLDNITPDIAHPSWAIFSTSCFGTGLFQLENYTKGIETILTIRPDSWWLNKTLTTADPLLHWEERFGNFTKPLQQLRIKIEPLNYNVLFGLEQGLIDLAEINAKEKVYFEENDDFTIQEKPQRTFSAFCFNCLDLAGNRPLGNTTRIPGHSEYTFGLALRKAIAYAIDRNEINNIIHGGGARMIYWPISPILERWCSENIIRYNFNLEKAKYFMDLYFQCSPSTGNATCFTFQTWLLTFTAILIGFVLVRKKEET